MPEYVVEAPFEDRRIKHETSKSRLHLPSTVMQKYIYLRSKKYKNEDSLGSA